MKDCADRLTGPTNRDNVTWSQISTYRLIVDLKCKLGIEGDSPLETKTRLGTGLVLVLRL
jgi:hypothetical protein